MTLILVGAKNQMNKFGKILIIAPHADDEVLGCGGIMQKYGSSVAVLYVTSFHPRIDHEAYLSERKSVLKQAGIHTSFETKFIRATNELDSVPISKVISELEKNINLYKPDTIFTCFPSYNQDHRVVYEATITATRPHDENHFVKNVLVYEQPETLHSQRIGGEVFKPEVFVSINIEDKIRLYSLYASQVREHRSVAAIRGLAALRGSYICKKDAEAFSVVRMSYE